MNVRKEERRIMRARGEVLVAIMNSPEDFALARDRHWYRIPVSSVQKWLRNRWPPRHLAFYQTRVFGEEQYAVNYFAEVLGIRVVARRQLFPDQPDDEKADRRYHQILLGPLQRVPKPIISRRWRRIVFIPTRWRKFAAAEEINDLFDDSPLEDRLWARFKRGRTQAERQELVQVGKEFYFLDFALYCADGKLDVETDGDVWHANPERAAQDNRRDNDLVTTGWRILRFNGYQIDEEMERYCLPRIEESINRLGGLEQGKGFPRKAHFDSSGQPYQPELFDDL